MECESWVFRVNAYDEESLGHFLSWDDADHLGVRVEWVKAWESPSLGRNPTNLQRLALSKLVDVMG